MRFYSKRPQTIEEPQVNLTPLIDVVFVILIVFMLLAPLVEINRIHLAEAFIEEPTSFNKKMRLNIYVQKEDVIFLEKAQVKEQELQALLKEAFSKNPKIVLTLFHDAKASFGLYEKIKLYAQEAGFSQVDVVLKGV